MTKTLYKKSLQFQKNHFSEGPIRCHKFAGEMGSVWLTKIQNTSGSGSAPVGGC